MLFSIIFPSFKKRIPFKIQKNQIRIRMVFYIALVILILALFSLWIKKSPAIWGSLIGASIVLLQASGKISIQGFIPIILTTIFILVLTKNLQNLPRFLFFVLTLFFSGAIFSCVLPGLPTCFNLSGVQVNYGKIFIAIPLIGLLIPNLSGKKSFSEFCKKDLPPSIAGAVLLLLLALRFQPPGFWQSFGASLSPLRFPIYLICTIIPEEALLRGFLQRELFRLIGTGFPSHAITVLISSALFCLFQTVWISDLSLLLLLFVAGCVYGTLYEMTRKIETNISCRFLTSCLCFWLLPGQGSL